LIFVLTPVVRHNAIEGDLAVVQVVDSVFMVISAQGTPGSYGETRRQQHSIRLGDGRWRA